MAAFRPRGSRMGLLTDIMGGDTIFAGEVPNFVATVGDGTWPAAAIVGGILQRTGPVGAYADTTDTAANILAALTGAGNAADIAPGLTWRFMVRNTVAQANTVALGVGVHAGTMGTSPNIAASLVREYLFTVLNSTPPVNLVSNTTNGSATVTFTLPTGTTGLSMGPSVPATVLTPGMTISGTGVTAGTRILSVTQGAGGITGVVMDANATATNSNVSLNFGPTFSMDSLRSSTL